MRQSQGMFKKITDVVCPVDVQESYYFLLLLRRFWRRCCFDIPSVSIKCKSIFQIIQIKGNGVVYVIPYT